MIRRAFIFALLCAQASFASAQSTIASVEGDTAFADAHWTVITSQCKQEAELHAQLTDNATYIALHTDLNGGTATEKAERLANLENLSGVDRFWAALITIQARVVLDLLDFSGAFANATDLEPDASERDEQLRHDRAMAAMALAKCFWPDVDERSELMASRWANLADQLFEGVCEIHFFTIMQLYLDAPKDDHDIENRKSIAANILRDHESYLELARANSQCGEFL